MNANRQVSLNRTAEEKSIMNASLHQTSSWLCTRVAVSTALLLSAILTGRAAHAHNLDASAVYTYFDADTRKFLDDRILNGWTAGTPLLQNGDEVGLVVKAVPDNGTTSGVGGYVTFYLPNGVQVVDAAYLMPGNDAADGLTDYDKVPMKGQALMPNVGSGGNPRVSLVGFTRGPNVAGVTAPFVNQLNVNNGTLPAVYGDLGIFYSTAPETAYGTYKGGMLVNNSGDLVGARTHLGRPLNVWDTWQLAAYGIAGSSNPAYPSAPLLDSNGRGNTAWGLANAVAGPESGYAWEFNLPDYQACDPVPYAPTSSCLDIATQNMGPWNRIQYPGSQIAFDRPGDTTAGFFNGGMDASRIGRNLATSPLPATTGQADGSPNAVRFAIGQLTLNSPEYVWIKLRVVDFTGMLDASGCPNIYVDTFGGDAGNDDIGKDHIWRYYDPNSVPWNGCLALGKPASREFVKIGETFQYDMKVYNIGATSLSNVKISDTLPAGVSFVSAAPAQASGPNPLVWNVGSLQAGQSFSSMITVRATKTGVLVNSASAEGKPAIGPDVETTTHERTPSGLRIPVLRQTKEVTPEVVVAPGTVEYTIRIENIGGGASGNPVVITENLPDGFRYQSLVRASVNGANVTGLVAINNKDASTPVVSVPSAIQPGGELVLVFQAAVAANLPSGSYCNSYVTQQGGMYTSTGMLACVNVGAGSIGDHVFRDWDKDRVQDAGEEGIGGVTISLYAGACPPKGAVLDTETTDSTGFYQFTGLPAGTYCVDAPAAGSGGLPPSYSLTTANDPMTVTLAENQVRSDVDFGYAPGGNGSVGDQVFDDANADGLFNGADKGIPAVSVRLYEDTNGNGIVDADDMLVATTTTDSNGRYSFPNLATGISYIAAVDEKDPDIAAYFQRMYGDAAGVVRTTDEDDAVSSLAGAYKDADFGFYKVVPGSIGDDVFLDFNANGVRDAGEDGVANVTVELYIDTNGNGVADPGEPLFATTTTDGGGKYLFENLPAGNYVVDIDATDAAIPAEYSPLVDSIPVALAAGEKRSDIDFPLVGLLTKTVDKSYDDPMVAPNTLTYTIAPRYPGGELLSSVVVGDLVPDGTTFVDSAPTSPNAGGIGVDVDEPADGQADNVEWNLGSSSAPVAGFAGGTAPKACQTTVAVAASADTWIDGGSIATNHGADTTIDTANAATDKAGLLRFDVSSATIPAGATLNSVSLSLTPDAGAGTNRQVSVQELRTAFAEGTAANGACTAAGNGAAWQGPGCTDDWQSAGGNFGASDYAATSLVTFNPTSNDTTITQGSAALTSVVGAWLSGGTNRGLALVPVGTVNNTVSWYTRASATTAFRPTLHITFTANGCTGTTVIRDTGANEVPDSFLQQDSGGNDNFGTSATLKTRFDANRNKYALVRFDVSAIPAGVTINSATMDMTVTGAQATSAVSVHRMLTAWIEGTNAANGVQWNDPNGTGTAGTWASGPFGSSDYDAKSYGTMSGATAGTKSLAITGLVQGWYDGTFENEGLVMLATARNSDVQWASSESTTASARPGLTVSWSMQPSNPVGISSISAGWSVAQSGDSFPVTMRLVNTGASPIANVRPSTPVVASTGGSTATCGSASPANATVPAGGYAEFVWQCAVTSAAPAPDLVTFRASATNGTTTWSSATSNGVIVSPVLRFQVNVNSPASVSEVTNTATMFEGASVLSASNTVHTALTSSIGDFVWADADADGVQDADEAGLPGVRVFLDANGNGAWDAGENFTTTDSSGHYLFTGLPNGVYSVVLDTTTLPAGWYPTTAPVLAEKITVSGQQIVTADFGATTGGREPGSIGDTVWIDANENGVIDAGEKGLASVVVELWMDANGNGVRDVGDFVVATTTTDANGNYLFDDLAPADYLVVVDTSSKITTDFGVESTIGAAMELVSGVNPKPVSLSSGEGARDADFGFNWGGSIGDFAWYDKDGDGVQDGPKAGCNDNDPVQECPASGMVAWLYYDANGNGSLDVGDPILDWKVTDANGFYEFTNLPPGSYIVKGSEGQVPAPLSSANAGEIGRMVHTEGSKRFVELGANEHDKDADFGFIEGAEVEGHVFYDANHNGLLDAGETGLEGIAVYLTGTDEFGNPVSLVAYTDDEGEYGFVVSGGDYTIRYDEAAIPPSLKDATTPTTIEVSPRAGEEIEGLDFGVDDSGTIGDFIWIDADADGSQDAGEKGLAGVTVVLWLDPNGDGNLSDATPVAVQATDASGRYLFDGLAPSTGAERYVVELVISTVPDGYTMTADPDEAGVCRACNGTSVVPLAGGASVLTKDFGFRPAATSSDVRIAKSGPASAAAGANVVFTIVVTNDGPDDATGVIVSDPTPAGLGFVSNSGACASAYPCSLGTIAAGQSRTISSTYSVPAGYASANPVVNTATVSSTSTDPDSSNNTATASVPLATVSADLSIVKRDPGTGTERGRMFPYTVVVTNNGPGRATGIVVSDSLDPETTYVSDTAGCTHNSGALTCPMRDLAAGESASFTITVSVDPTAPTSETREGSHCDGHEDLCNRASVSAATLDPVPSNNSDTEATNVFGPDLRIVKSDSGKGVNRLEEFAYTIEVSNNGVIAATNVTVVDVLDPETEYVSDDAGCTEAPEGTITCAIGTVEPGATVAFHVVVSVRASASTAYARESGDCTGREDLCNVATVTCAEGDANESDNRDEEPTDVKVRAGSADLAITKTDVSSPVQAGSFATYTISVANVGPNEARDVRVVDIADPSLEYVSGTLPCRTDETGLLLVCELGTIPAGATVAFDVIFHVNASAPTGGSFTGRGCPGGEDVCNHASVSTTATDPDPTDNRSEAATDVVPATEVAALTLVKSDIAAEPVAPGSSFSYEIVVTNAGPSVAREVIVHEMLGESLRYVGDDADCTVTTMEGSARTTLACAMGDLVPGASVRLHVQVSVADAAGTDSSMQDGDCDGSEDLCNTAFATSAAAESNAADNGDSEPTDVSYAPMCGNGSVDFSEACDTPNGEICNNGIDDDGDNMLDCVDPDCSTPGFRGCTGNCELAPACQPILNDPATLSWNSVYVHGRFIPTTPADPFRDGLRFVISNEAGIVYSAKLEPGDMRVSTGPSLSKWVFKDKAAKKGMGSRDGIYRVGIKQKREKTTGEISYAFRFQGYGDMSRAMYSNMTTHIYVGDDVAFLEAEWGGQPGMWELTLKRAYGTN